MTFSFTSWGDLTAPPRRSEAPRRSRGAPRIPMRLAQAVEALGAARQDLALRLRRELGTVGDELRRAREEPIGVRIVGRPQDLVRADVVGEDRETALDRLERDPAVP